MSNFEGREMANLFVCDRHTKQEFDCMFYVRNATAPADLSACHVGDSVTLYFADEQTRIDLIAQHGPPHVRRPTDLGLLQIPCVVSRRNHGLVWESPGRMQIFTRCSVTVEAISDEWQDVLLWVVLDARPEWIPKT